MLTWLTLIFSSLMALQIPQGLNSSDQERVLEIVGLGTSSKFLSNAYPLGGYSGLEVSLSVEAIDTNGISQLGNTADSGRQLAYPSLTIGKGIYNSSDLFLNFVLPTATQEISKFGVGYRWGFYQALFLPLNFSLSFNADTLTIKNKISARNIGVDLLVGMTLSQFSFFLGGGYANSSGDFIGGASGVTLSTVTESQKVESSHFMFGATYNFEPFFIGLSLNRYSTSVYSAKVGFLF